MTPRYRVFLPWSFLALVWFGSIGGMGYWAWQIRHSAPKNGNIILVPGKIDIEAIPYFYDDALRAPVKIIDARPPIQVALAEEIARIEGFYDKTTLPAKLHNPGALVFAGQDGAVNDMDCPSDIVPRGAGDLVDRPCRFRAPYARFSTDDAGWAALHRDIAAKWKQLTAMRLQCVSEASPQQCMVWYIAYNWPASENGERYANTIIERLKKRGLL